MNRKDWLRVVALAWIVVASAWFAQHLGRANTAGPTALQTYAFGDVFIDFWAAARLALMGRVADVYDLAKFHDFQVPILDGPIHHYQ